MANAKDLKKRISSVKNTQQITKAMKMVSAAKLRRAQEAILAVRPYSMQIQSVVQGLIQERTLIEENPYFQKKQEGPRRLHLIIVSSDRGLCGGFNGSVIKTVQRFLKTETAQYDHVECSFFGKKAYEFFRNKDISHRRYFNDVLTRVTYKQSQQLSQEILSGFLSGDHSDVKFVYTEFKSAIAQKVVLESFLPLELPPGEASELTVYEPNQEELLERLLPRYFTMKLHRILLESLASEHGARMTAMENATKNAGEMIYKLNLLYNKTRQAAITKELLEIISGCEAQNIA